jgi:hypothetical protein
MDWNDVGNWIKGNAGSGAALVGSLLTGNVPGAVAAGVALVSSATGSNDPSSALLQLQNDPATMVRLKELANENEASIRNHIEEMTKAELQDRQHEHSTTQETIRAGDNAEDKLVRWTRPGMSWASLFAAIYYALGTTDPSMEILFLLLTPPWTYLGLREVGKGIRSFTREKADVMRKPGA